jgi:hypothetical protein
MRKSIRSLAEQKRERQSKPNQMRNSQLNLYLQFELRDFRRRVTVVVPMSLLLALFRFKKSLVSLFQSFARHSQPSNLLRVGDEHQISDLRKNKQGGGDCNQGGFSRRKWPRYNAATS